MEVTRQPATELPPATILLVEDDGPLRECLVEIMEEAGYRVAAAPDGAAALALLAAGGAGLPDLILLDLMMPNLNGMEFRARQRMDPRMARIPVVVISARGDADRLADALGAVSIRKPFSIDDLLRALDEARAGRKIP